MIDADEIIEIDAERCPLALDAAAYYLRQGPVEGEFEYRVCKLMRLGIGWRWEGVLHEYPACDPQPVIGRIDGLKVRYHQDGARSQRPLRDKYLDDAAVLEAALQREPGNARYAFYLAQSLRDAGERERALEAYHKRSTMGGWAEEVWYTLFQIAVLKRQLGHPPGEVVDAFLRAYEYRPQRAEALCELANYLRLAGRHASAHLFAQRAAATPETDDLLFVDRSAYIWRSRDEQAVAAWYLGDHSECARLCRELLADPRLPAHQRERIQANLGFCRC